MSQHGLFDGPISGLYPAGKQQVVDEDKGQIPRVDFPLLLEQLGRVDDIAQYLLVYIANITTARSAKFSSYQCSRLPWAHISMSR